MDDRVTDYKEKKIVVIRRRGQFNKGQLPDGTWVERPDKLYVPEWGRFVPTAPYDEHFLYEVPPKYRGAAIRCTCGSFGVVAGYSAYKDDASQQGLLVVCYAHANTGRHLDGGSRWI